MQNSPSWATPDENINITDGRVVSVADKFLGTTISLKNKIVLNQYFKITDPTGMYATVSYTDHNNKSVSYTVNAEEFIAYGKNYGVAIDTLKIADAVCEVTVTVYDENKNEVVKVTDSINSYLAKQLTQTDPIYMMTAKFAASALAYSK